MSTHVTEIDIPASPACLNEYLLAPGNFDKINLKMNVFYANYNLFRNFPNELVFLDQQALCDKWWRTVLVQIAA